MPLDALPPPQPSAGAVRRMGTLTAQRRRATLSTPPFEAGGLRREDLAAAERACRAGLVAALKNSDALLRPGCQDASLVLSDHRVKGATVHWITLMVPGCSWQPPLQPDAAGRVGDVDEVPPMARETSAWCRCVPDADRLSLDAYLSDCLA